MTSPSHPHAPATDLFARKLTAHLTQAEQTLPYVVTERLRASREQAIAQRKRSAAPLRQLHPETAVLPVGIQADGSIALGQSGRDSNDTTFTWLRRTLTALPLMALVGGLAFISVEQDTRSTVEVAEVDAALLTSDLPPAAYADPGFWQFLQTTDTQIP